MIAQIVWNVDPVLFSVGPLSIRWYGLMWAVGFLVGYQIMTQIFKQEKLPVEWADSIFAYMAVGTIIGARLGHCFFYGWDYYTQNPLEILKIWEGGLSSHGGAIGILIAMYIFNRRVAQKGYIWVLDRLIIAVAFCGACIRFGNLMNSEIYGVPTTMPWGFVFVREGETVACHPTQIYEMLYCLIAFVVAAVLYRKTQLATHTGIIFGIFLLIVFVSRFLLEFIKNDQEAFEANMILNMGQILSLPLIIWGIWLLVRKK